MSDREFNMFRLLKLFIKGTIYTILFIILFFPSRIHADRYATYFCREGIIEDNGTLIKTTNAVHGVNVLGFVCLDKECSRVLPSWNGDILTTDNDQMTLIFPTFLLNINGYGLIFFKDGYIPWEERADFFGTLQSDPAGPFFVYLSRKKICKVEIDKISFDNTHNITSVVSFYINSPLLPAGRIDYSPSELLKLYSSKIDIEIEIINEEKHTILCEKKLISLPFGLKNKVSFDIKPNSKNLESGKYKAILSATPIDNNCQSGITSSATILFVSEDGILKKMDKANNDLSFKQRGLYYFEWINSCIEKYIINIFVILTSLISTLILIMKKWFTKRKSLSIKRLTDGSQSKETESSINIEKKGIKITGFNPDGHGSHIKTNLDSDNQNDKKDDFISNTEKIISPLKSHEIYASIENVPPAQRRCKRKNYLGLRINWELKLFSVDERDSLYEIWLHPIINFNDKYIPNFNRVICKVPIAQYKEICILHEGSIIRVEGAINRINEIEVHLEDVKLEIIQPIYDKK
jgi:hypothetical protein